MLKIITDQFGKKGFVVHISHISFSDCVIVIWEERPGRLGARMRRPTGSPHTIIQMVKQLFTGGLEV